MPLGHFWNHGNFDVLCAKAITQPLHAVTTKAAKRFRFLKTLKHAGVTVDDLAHYYQTVVRPVSEYACPVWHSSLSKQQAKSLEDVQRRALQIIVGNTPYSEACHMFDIQSLEDRWSELCRTLFRQTVNNESHSLHYLLPPKHDTYLVSRLQSASTYPILCAKTNRLKNSFLPYCLTNYQWHYYQWHLCVTCYCMLACL